MPRGGRRSNAGRKSSWSSGCSFEQTKLIRVPSAISEELLNIAHNLDLGEVIELETNSNSLVTESNKLSYDDLLIRAKEVLKDESIVGKKNRYIAIRAICSIFGVDKLDLL